MSERLNPRLTRRSLASNLGSSTIDTADPIRSQSLSQAPSLETRSSTSESTESSFRTSSTSEPPPTSGGFFPGINNPKRHLLHHGKWIPKEFEVGRPVRRTGLWSCCGHNVHYSLYCESIERRAAFRKAMEDEINAEKDEAKAIEARKVFLADAIKSIVTLDTPELAPRPTNEKLVMDTAHSDSSGFNAPMLVQWISRHVKEEPTMIDGLEFVLHHLSTGEGCVLLYRHKVLETVIQVAEQYPNHVLIQQHIACIVRQVLDCNFTRDHALSASYQDIVPLVFGIAHRFMNSASHVEPASRALMQCARQSDASRLLFSLNVPAYLLTFAAKKFMRHVAILRSVITLCNWLASDAASLRALFKLRVVSFAARLLRQHADQGALLAPAIHLLARVVAHVPAAMQQVLRLQLAEPLVAALRVLYADRDVTLTALRLLQMLSRTSEGFAQLNAVHNAWQVMTAGTLQGDALVHRLPGAFQNPGWALGDTPYLPELDRQRLRAKANLAHSLQAAPRQDWTVSSLRQYMGLSLDGQTLAINLERHRVFFELVGTLDLLPAPGEEKERWFQRLREFEHDNDLQIEEMVLTVLEMKRRDQLNREYAKASVRVGSAGGEDFLGSVKPMYVHGQVITAQYLDDRDMSLDEALHF